MDVFFGDVAAVPWLDLDAPWKTIGGLDEILDGLTPAGVLVEEGATVAEGVVLGSTRLFLGRRAKVDPGVVFTGGPVYVGEDVEIRAGAYLRGPVFLGPGVVVGHATEVKNALFLPRARAPHFNYVGDSILGENVNLGAGAIISNFKLDGGQIKVTWRGARVRTGVNKLGAILGQNCSLGCNTVCNPGTVLEPGTKVFPLATVRGGGKSSSGVKKCE